MDQQKSCSLKLAPKKGAAKTRTCFSIYFFTPFSIFYIPHNYVILQAVPHAIPQTQSAFYSHRLFLTTSRHFLQTNLLVTKLRLLRCFNFGSHLLTSIFDGLFRNRLIVFAFRDHYLQTNFCQRIQSTTDMPRCSCDRTFSSPEPSFLGQIKPTGSGDVNAVRTKQLSQLYTVQPRSQGPISSFLKRP